MPATITRWNPSETLEHALAAAPNPGLPIDNTNHDLVHALSVRMDAHWHDLTYNTESHCEGCRALFERLCVIDREAVDLLTSELAAHVQSGRFPLSVPI